MKQVKIFVIVIAVFCFFAVEKDGRSLSFMIDTVILFSLNKAKLSADDKAALDEVAKIMEDNSWIKKLSVEGHANDIEKDPDKLAKRRAERVKEYLVQRGMNPDRLEVRSYGSVRPVATSRTKEGQIKNRRVDFDIEEP